MRTKKAIYNMISSLLAHFISMFLAFLTQSIFVRNLGTEYLGLSGLLNNIFSMLGVAELGIGSAIVFNLYKPIAENNTEKIKSLMDFYKKCYQYIAIFIFVMSIVILPFLNNIVGTTTIENRVVYFVFLLFMIEIIASYLLSYKRSMFQADQKNYVIDIIHIIYLIVLNTSQIVVLITTKNYILFLIIKILFRILENIIITITVNKKYPFLKEKAKIISRDEKEGIFKKVKGLILHKIGTFIVAGTDNIIISKFLGVGVVGLYSNYFLIINALSTVINQIFSSFKSSIGNLLVEENKEKNYNTFKKLQFLNFWLAMMSTLGIYFVIEDFISIWIGKQYILGTNVLFALCVCNYIYITKLCISSFKEAAGIFYEDRFIPIIESFCNIFFSILLVNKMGLSGVFCGTIITYMITHIYTYPKIVYRKVFEKKYLQYFIDNIGYITFTMCLFILYLFLFKYVKFANIFIDLFARIGIIVIFTNIILLIFYHNSEEFIYYKNLILKKIIRR